MKTLSVRTVRKGLASLGFVDLDSLISASEIAMVLPQINVAARVFAKWSPDTGNIELRDGRWTEAMNVHIVSYFRFPWTRAELATMLSEIKRIYSSLCGTRFE